jgi:hypothetical protein
MLLEGGRTNVGICGAWARRIGVRRSLDREGGLRRVLDGVRARRRNYFPNRINLAKLAALGSRKCGGMIDFWQGVGFLGDLRGGFQPLHAALRTTEVTENRRILAQCPLCNQFFSVVFLLRFTLVPPRSHEPIFVFRLGFHALNLMLFVPSLSRCHERAYKRKNRPARPV